MCVVCGSRRAQRGCPARSAGVCSSCCGSGRRRTIDCPEACGHLQAARHRALVRLAALSGGLEFELAWRDVLDSLRRALLSSLRAVARGAAMAAMRAALVNVAETLRTRSAGLIYEYRSTDPAVQVLADELISVAARYEVGQHGWRRVSPEDVAMCLRHLERQAAQAVAKGISATALVDLMAQTVGHEPAGSGGQREPLP